MCRASRTTVQVPYHRDTCYDKLQTGRTSWLLLLRMQKRECCYRKGYQRGSRNVHVQIRFDTALQGIYIVFNSYQGSHAYLENI